MENYEKKYKEALEKARQLCDYPTTKPFISDLQDLFPELKKDKESDDERIRKEIVSAINIYCSEYHRGTKVRDDMLTWLEKQGEQNPVISEDALREGIAHFGITQYQIDNWLKKYVDVKKQGVQKPVYKVEPKFKVGDWITNGDYTWKIVEVKPLDYILQSQDGNIVDDTISHVDEQFHSFTVEDAKDGDVLVDKYGNIGIYQGDKNAVMWHSYCYCGVNKGFYDEENHEFPCYPATKEQRDTLEIAMTNAGYTFDFDKKELKKIEQKPWSEEDEKILNTIINDIQERHPEAMWKINAGSTVVVSTQYIIDWLKSLKDRHTWKPSDRQMDALDYYANSLCTYCDRQDDLRSLFNDLKQL